MHEFEELAPIIERLSIAQSEQRRFEIESVAAHLGLSTDAVRARTDVIASWGLALTGEEEGGPPLLFQAARQYLASGGQVELDVLRFLPVVINDLVTRAALLHSGTVMIDEFRGALIDGSVVEHAQAIMPKAFEQAVTEAIAVNLFAAAVALMARLSDGEPAGCVAEEILAVELMEGARDWLDRQKAVGALSAENARNAAGELSGLFELFQDDDVLDMFDMEEPADAAVAGHSARNVQMGIADQRLEAWFEPFSWTIATGYLGK
jgi:hypothetical protein